MRREEGERSCETKFGANLKVRSLVYARPKSANKLVANCVLKSTSEMVVPHMRSNEYNTRLDSKKEIEAA